MALIQKLWEVAWDMWDHRNKVLHDKDNTLLSEHRQREIAEEFAAGSASVTQEAKILFRPGLEAILSGSEAMQTAWLVWIRRARNRFKERQGEDQLGFRAERRAMAGWLRGSSSR